MDLFLPSEEATCSLGRALAPLLHKKSIVALFGDLGAGKTTLARAMIQAFCGQHVIVPSPTFSLMNMYETPTFTLVHIDLYRLETKQDITELALEDIYDQDALIIEWPERLGSSLAISFPNRLELFFEHEQSGRRVAYKEFGSWQNKITENFIQLPL